MASRSVRTAVWTGAIASVTIVGAWSGAKIKMDRDSAQQVQTIRDATIEERIALLESRKTRLEAQKKEFQRKILDIETSQDKKSVP